MLWPGLSMPRQSSSWCVKNMKRKKSTYTAWTVRFQPALCAKSLEPTKTVKWLLWPTFISAKRYEEWWWERKNGNEKRSCLLSNHKLLFWTTRAKTWVVGETLLHMLDAGAQFNNSIAILAWYYSLECWFPNQLSHRGIARTTNGLFMYQVCFMGLEENAWIMSTQVALIGVFPLLCCFPAMLLPCFLRQEPLQGGAFSCLMTCIILFLDLDSLELLHLTG